MGFGTAAEGGVRARRVGWGILLGAGLLLLGVAAIRGSWCVHSPALDLPEDAWRRIPAEARFALRLDLPTLLGSEAWSRWVVARGGDRGLRRLRARCGFDPLEGVEEVVLWRGGAEGRLLDGLAVQLRGELPVERLAGCVRRALRDEGQTEVRPGRLSGHRALLSRSGRSGAVALGSSLLLLGSTVQLRAALGALQGRRHSARKAWPLPWDRLEAAGPIRWIVRFPDARPAWWPEPLGQVRWLFGGLRLGPPVALRLTARFASSEGARRAQARLGVVRRRLVAGRVSRAKRAWAEPLAALHLARAGEELTLSGLWGIEELDRLFASLLEAVSVGAGEQDLGAVQPKPDRDGGGPGGALAVPKEGAGLLESPDTAGEHEQPGEAPGGVEP